MCTIFWDAEGILLIDFMPQKVTITGVYYADLLHKLHISIKEKLRGKLTQVPLLVQDNAPAHRSHVGQAAILESGFEEMHLPPYFPNLAPSDYHLLPSLKQHLRGQRYSTDDELKYATEEWLKEQSELFYSQALRNFDSAINSALTNSVITLKNKCMLINLSLL